MTQDKCQGCAVQQGTHVPMGAVIHPDDLAVDALAKAMKAKLAKKRAQGYGGWDTDCTQQRLSDLLRKHVDKGDPIDVANLCAFLLARGEGIAALQSAQAAPQASEPYAVLVFERGEEGPFDRKPVKPNSMPHLHAKRDPHYDYIELYTHPTQQGLDALTQAARDVIAERARQVNAKGYEPDADDGYEHGELAFAAATYAVLATNAPKHTTEHLWPWSLDSLKVGEPRRMLVKAGALIQAAIEREDRSLAAQAKQGGV